MALGVAQRLLSGRTLVIIGILYFTFFGGAFYTDANFWPHVLNQIIVTAIFAFWLVNLWRSGRGFPVTSLDWSLLALVIALVVSAVAGWFPRISLEQIWTPLVHVLGFYLLVDLLRRGRQRWIFEGLFLAGAVVVVLTGIELVSWYFGLSLVPQFSGWVNVGAGLIPPYLHDTRLAMTNANIQSAYVALLIPVTAAWALTVRARDYRQGGWLLAAGLVGALLLTQSRGGMLALGGGVGVMALFWVWRRFVAERWRAWPRLLVAAGVIVSGVAALILVIGVGWRFVEASRRELWRAALAMLGDDPFTGVGYGTYGAALRRYRDPASGLDLDSMVSAHNLYLHTGAETGVIGLAVMVGLVAAFLVAWRRQWLVADAPRRRRLEGCLAALVGFGVQSSFDAFSATPVILPLLIYAAFTVGSAPAAAVQRPRRWPAVVAAVILTGYAVAFIPIDAAMFNLMRSKQHLGAGDLPAALEAGERALSIDPALDIYQAHVAYVQGLRAAEEPGAFLDRAIAAHETILRIRPDFDLGHANLGALYAQHGDMNAAAAELQRAAAIQPRNAIYWLKLGEYREATGDADGALDAFVRALVEKPDLGYSAFWQEPGDHPARVQAFDAAIHEAKPEKALAITVLTGDLAAAQALLADEPSLYEKAPLDAGRYFQARGDYPEAAEWFDVATAQMRAKAPYWEWWPPYLHRAEMYMAQSDCEAAQREARIARFLGSTSAMRANYVLAQCAIAEGDWDEAERLLPRAAFGRTVFQQFAVASYGVLFGQLAAFDYLPQLRVPGRGAWSYEPWLVLAERYEATGRLDQAARVYEVIAGADPYLAADMAARLAALDS